MSDDDYHEDGSPFDPESNPEYVRGDNPLYDLAVESSRIILRGLKVGDDQCATQLIGSVYFLMAVSQAFGGRFIRGDSTDGALDSDGKPIKVIIMLDSVSGERIDTDIILARIDEVIKVIKDARRGDDSLTDGDL